ncbi:MAG: lactate utilization protein [Candidatus Omnitrophica bacterium]|nr:lactate utilization protein [Candidatus Omnitrophota bacterium]
MNDQQAGELIKRWQKRNIRAVYCRGRKEAVEKILQEIPLSAAIGLSGSLTLSELKLVEKLKERGNKIYDQNQPGLSREESLALRKQGSLADYYLVSPNAISENGELVFFSAYGNRTAGVAYADKLIVVSGTNKIAADLAQAVKRARELATPLNCKRLGWQTPCLDDGICREEACRFPEYKRMCCQVLIIEAEIIPERIKVFLVDEELGF